MATRTATRCLQLVTLLAMVLVSACVTTPSPDARRRLADELAGSADLRRTELAAGEFTLRGYQRTGEPGQPLTVYIEGDGFAWKTRHRQSDDPTPTDPLALRLAVQDPAANLAYLARPCQYLSPEALARCAPDYWSGRRYAEAVIVATDAALTQLRARAQANGLHLVGYSGGAAVAALVAARRRDVLSLRTVAGNLDHTALTTRHGVTALEGSLNPIDQAARLSALPQRHFVGGKDRIVPADIARGFVNRLDSNRCAVIEVIAPASHDAGWIEDWPHLLALELTCRP